MSAATWIGIGLLGGLGAVMRYMISAAVNDRSGSPFPWGTFVVNLSGAFALGLLAGAVTGDALNLVGTGLLGGYTTFSTWMFESERAAEAGRPRMAWVYLLVSLALGLLAAWLGIQVGELL